ncbi:MerR family transcriptional regulator [Rhodococcus sp. NPDC127528]|uniref:MerR family transcriptional regulator n=1 Tax=unclassified Rhodococcus (in: high G+C Gram-positive bacteria) TaxID=192944 RepID=UPI00362E7FA8
MDGYTVGDLARLSGVSVRTLHHYDSIGLLTPRRRSAGNHRIYSEAEVGRLRQILLYRELEFGLDEIAAILAEPDTAADDHLRRQHRLLRERRDRLDTLVEAVERELRARRAGIALSAEEQFEIFGTARFEESLAGVEDRWDQPAVSAELRRRAVAYTAADWREIKAEAEANIREFAEAITAGEPPTGAVAMAAAERHRAHLSRWFFECGPALHRQVAESYVADPAAATHWDDLAPGFTGYVRSAILANADRLGAS